MILLAVISRLDSYIFVRHARRVSLTQVVSLDLFVLHGTWTPTISFTLYCTGRPIGCVWRSDAAFRQRTIVATAPFNDTQRCYVRNDPQSVPATRGGGAGASAHRADLTCAAHVSRRLWPCVCGSPSRSTRRGPPQPTRLGAAHGWRLRPRSCRRTAVVVRHQPPPGATTVTASARPCAEVIQSLCSASTARDVPGLPGAGLEARAHQQAGAGGRR